MAGTRNGRTRIKICGIRDHDTALVAADAGADAVGFVLAEGSPRTIDADLAAEIVFALPPLVSSVAVVQDLSVDEFAELEQACPATLVQLHGKEPEGVVRACGPGVIKGFRYEAATIESNLRRWGKLAEVDAVLIDGSDGGAGTAFDWSALRPHLNEAIEGGYACPVFLAGGLTPENVGEAIRAVRPYAVDVSSGVESKPGVKDHGLIRAFCRAVREADAG